MSTFLWLEFIHLIIKSINTFRVINNKALHLMVFVINLCTINKVIFDNSHTIKSMSIFFWKHQMPKTDPNKYQSHSKFFAANSWIWLVNMIEAGTRYMFVYRARKQIGQCIHYFIRNIWIGFRLVNPNIKLKRSEFMCSDQCHGIHWRTIEEQYIL